MRVSPSPSCAPRTQLLMRIREKATREAHLTGALGHGRFDAGAKMSIDKCNGPSSPSLAVEQLGNYALTFCHGNSNPEYHAVAKCQGFQWFSETADATCGRYKSDLLTGTNRLDAKLRSSINIAHIQYLSCNCAKSRVARSY